jgi:hypothetical protein
MERIGDALRQAGVGVIYLVHGNLVGADAFGLLPELSRVFPSTSGAVRRVIRRIVDRLTGDLGNFTGNYAKLFEASINRSGERAIAVRRFHWSSENNHLGRADGAIRLIDELDCLELEAGSRVMLWGHSHAGNVFALMTNLLGGNREAVEGFFEAARVYYRWPLLGCVDIPVWWRVRQLLRNPDASIRRRPLDLVTFGTPIRYGWDSAGYARLLHFVYHRPVEGMPEYRAPFPPNLKRVLRGAEGDYVQQLGIAGTDIRPRRLAWRARLAEKRLERLLQSQMLQHNPWDRFKAGAIVPDEGTTLLVDYGPMAGGVARRHAGHAVYTRSQWLLFHAEEVVRQCYQSPGLTGGDDLGLRQRAG